MNAAWREKEPSRHAAPGRDYYSNSRHEMVGFLPPSYSRVLEVGCGEGAFATLLKQPCEIWGVEMEPMAAARAATRMTKVLVGPYDHVQAGIPIRYFDLIVCNDVIEHLPDPDAFLRSVRSRLVPGGQIVASLPNVRHWEVLWQLLVGRDWKYGVEGILDRTHLRFFTAKSMRRLFEEAGFVVECQRGINGTFNPFRRQVLRLAGLLTLGQLSDLQFRQFGIRARLK